VALRPLIVIKDEFPIISRCLNAKKMSELEVKISNFVCLRQSPKLESAANFDAKPRIELNPALIAISKQYPIL
jgi:hypothetical protein